MSQPLFSAQSIEDVMRSRRTKIDEELAEITDPNELADPKTAKGLRETGSLALPELSRSEATFDTQERGQNLYVTVSIPIADGWYLLDVKPKTFTTVQPRGHVERSTMYARIGKPTLKMSDSFPRTTTPAEIKAWAAAQADHVQEYIDFLRPDVEMHNDDVERLVREGLDRRWTELANLGDLQGGLQGGI